MTAPGLWTFTEGDDPQPVPLDDIAKAWFVENGVKGHTFPASAIGLNKEAILTRA